MNIQKFQDLYLLIAEYYHRYWQYLTEKEIIKKYYIIFTKNNIRKIKK